jgi:predicted DNA repair protein MutK
MTTGLLALLDDIATLAKLAAASLDDAAAQSAKAASKAAGLVIDDAAVTPRYFVGISAERELPIVGKIVAGSLRNKLLILLPAALLLKAFAPWIITPLLMIGGLFLCFEGYHKVADLWKGRPAAKAPAEAATANLARLEQERVASAIRTDFILSAEIMAVALGSLSDAPLWVQGGALAGVGVAMTALVYGAVAVIVKADDVGLWLSRSVHQAARSLGRGVVHAMPPFLSMLTFVGMLAMFWVGGGILLHGVAELGWKQPEHWMQELGAAAASGIPIPVRGFIAWLVQATLAGILGLAAGALTKPAVHWSKRQVTG